MTLLFALACWFHPPMIMQSATPAKNRIHSNGQLVRPPGR
jgi:hypothetical protein